jgi:DNA replication protein DnaC
MNAITLERLKTQMEELDFDFLPGQLETLLHEESQKDRPLVETLISMFDVELTQKRQRAAKMRLKLSRIPQVKMLDQLDLSDVEGISQKQLTELKTLSFIDRKENVILMGSSGLAKTHIMLGLCHNACMAGYTSYFLSCIELVEMLIRAKQSRRLKNKLKALCKPHLLAIDEVGYQQLTQEESQLFFQMVSERYEKGSIILTTNKSFGQWAELMGEQAVATATLDRLLHHSHVFILKGESYRLKNRIKNGLVPRAFDNE